MSRQLRTHYTHTKSHLDLTKLFRCLALDVVTEYTYGESFESLLKSGFDEPLLDAFDKFGPASYFVGALKRSKLSCNSGIVLTGMQFVMFPRIRLALNPIMDRLPIPVFQAVPKMTAVRSNPFLARMLKLTGTAESDKSPSKHES